MILQRFIADALSENCYVLADEQHRRAVVVDPGSGVADQVAKVLEEDGLELECVLLTHGHPDHVWDAAKVAGERPVYISEPDLHRLENPLGNPSQLTPMLAQILPMPWERPALVRETPARFFEGGGAELAPGVTVRALLAPGHSEGSTVFFLAGDWDAETGAMAGVGAGPGPLVVTGDVIFQGGIGRTDLPGGDDRVMRQTLRTLCQVIDPAAMLFPGHGPATTMERELRSNPYLR